MKGKTLFHDSYQHYQGWLFVYKCGRPWERGLPQRPQGPQQPQHSEHAQDLGARIGDERHQNVNDRNHHQHPVQKVPAAPQVGLFPEAPAQSHDLDTDQEQRYEHTAEH